jgi:hypothetical protein
MIGGALANPVASYPALFSTGSLFDRFPYLLPNLFSACCVFMGLVVGILFLEETHAEKKWQRDRGIELGKFLFNLVPCTRASSAKGKKPEKRPLLGGESDLESDSDTDELLPGYRSTESSPRLTSARISPVQDPFDLEAAPQIPLVAPEKKPVVKIFTRPVILNIVSYGILAL